MTKKEAFYAAAKLLANLPVDTLVLRKHFKGLKPEQKEELARYIKERLERNPLLVEIGRKQIKDSEFTSDYYSSRRGFPYRPAIYQLYGGLVALGMGI